MNVCILFVVLIGAVLCIQLAASFFAWVFDLG